METVSNIITSASTTMFGNNQDQNNEDVTSREPVAGSQGQGTKEEPYDRGNEESTNTGREESSIQPSAQKG